MKPKKLTLIFDGDCVLCRGSVRWLQQRETHVPIDMVPALRPDTMAQYGHIPGYGDNMVVVAEDGRSWVGPPDAYLVAMWAVRGTRALSYLLSLPVLKTITARVIQLIAGNRHLIGRLAGNRDAPSQAGDGHCERCVAAV
ncbi:MAG: DUF393 domain-containing protein [Acidimicrobiia bacterium]|nr:DUF393 domain-containing protein [Acidimicrobiia bacterium]